MNASTRSLPRWREHAFADPANVAGALAAAVAERLRAAIAERGRALLAVSGGTTPRRFLQQLATQELEWTQVIVTLCDERWVAPTNVRSNSLLVADNLLRGNAAPAYFVPLYSDAPDPESALSQVEARIGALPLPLDVVVLGLGNDGHTASLFANGSRIREALDPAGPHRVLPMRSPTAGEPRMTLTLPVLAGAREAFLHIEGQEKRALLQRMMAGDGSDRSAPLRAVVDQMRILPEVYWCP